MNISHKSSQDKKHRQGERGNVMFYILIAVALIAALSYAVSSSMRGGGQSLSEDRARLMAAEIIEYASIVSKAVQQLRLRGCAENEISFENSIDTDYTNGSAPSDNTCHIFHVSGGGVEYREPLSEWIDSAYSAENDYSQVLYTAASCIDQVGTGDSACQSAGTSVAELIMALPFIHESICIEINRKAGVGTPGAAPPVDLNAAWNVGGRHFTGIYQGGTRIQDTALVLDGQRTACFQGTTTPNGGFHFYKVLQAR